MDEIVEEQIEELEVPLAQGNLVDLSLYAPDARPVNTSVVGLITDEANLPIEGALIKLGSLEYLSDEQGRFVAINVTLNSLGSSYTVEKEGYFKGIRSFKPQLNTVEHTSVQLKKKKVVGSFNATLGGTINTVNQLSITFPPNAIVDAEGNLVQGNVQVEAAWIDPRISEQLPGSLIGLNSALEEVSLASYSMAAVELTVNGQEVNIAPEMSAEIAFPIPQDLRSSAPEEIPLWSLEEDLGLWIEEGVAIKDGIHYIGNVTHFSFWNCDITFDRVDIFGTVENQNGDPVTGMQVTASTPSFGVIGSSYTNSVGLFGGRLPRGEVITLEFKNGDCESQEIEVGPFESNVFLDDIVMEVEMGTIRGRVTGCQGEVLENAFVRIESSTFSLPTYSNQEGEWNVAYSTLCELPEVIFVQAMVGTTLFESEQQVKIPSENVNFGDVAVCDEVVIAPPNNPGTQISCGVGGVQVPVNSLEVLSYMSTENENGKLTLLVSSNQIGFKIKTLFPLLDPSTNQYTPENWDLAVGTPIPIDFFSFSQQLPGQVSPDPTVLYRCGPGIDESIEDAVYFPMCDDVEFTIAELNINPIPNGDFALMQSGDRIAIRIEGTLPNGESLEIDLLRTF